MPEPAEPTLAHRTYLVTGANTGIGKETARELANRGAHVILACRSVDKTRAVLDELRAETGNARLEAVALDLADFASVRACAEALLARDLPIHGLINNAGLGGLRGQTKDGFELAFGTNHLGHYLLTRLLLERVRASARPGAPARIVNVASDAHFRAPKVIDWAALRRPTPSVTGFEEYALSKLANVLFSLELARRVPAEQVCTYAVHPGVIASDIWERRLPRPAAWLVTRFMASTADGAKTTLHCATAPDLAAHTGRYYAKQRDKYPSRTAQDPALARELWERSAAWTGLDA